MGNRIQMVTGQTTTDYAYDSMNRLTGATGMGFDWDADGNLLYMHDGSDAWNYTYDPEDRLTNILKNDAFLSRFWYDADGRRVRINDTANGRARALHIESVCSQAQAMSHHLSME